jgi:Reverse transcriptase (RNA-dependent DNA polymerase)
MTRIQDVLNFLSSIPEAFITELDVTAGYHQVSIIPEHRHLTAYITFHDLKECNYMCMGYRNSMQVFACNMNLIFASLLNIIMVTYIDNIYVVTPLNKQAHLNALTRVLDHAAKFNLKLRPSKAKFFQQEIKTLEHHFSLVGVKPLQCRLDLIVTATHPMNLKDFECFLELANYYQRYIQNYAQISSPLESLLEKSFDFH